MSKKNNPGGPELVKSEDIEKVINWKLYYDKNSGHPLGSVLGTASLVCVCAPGEKLPRIGKTNTGDSQIDVSGTEDHGVPPPHIEIRNAVMIILKKRKGEK